MSDASPLADEIKILTWMDDLLDTRLSTMLRYDIVKTLDLIPQGYDLRTADNFIWEGLGISEKVWQQLWDNRDDEILYKSRRTGVPDFIRELLAEQMREPISTPHKIPVSLTINTYPYYLTKEVKDAWRDVYKEMIHPLLEVKFIRKAYNSLSPGFVISNYNYLIHYDWEKWAAEIGNSPEKASLTMLTVIGPRIWKTAPDEKELEQYKEFLEGFDVHMLGEIAAALVFQLRLVPVDMWVAFKDNHGFSDNQRLDTEVESGVPRAAD